MLKEMVIENGFWNFDLFQIWLPKEIIDRIVSILPPSPLVGADIVAWAGTSLRSFFIKSAYKVVK